jgi:hypothetical protein
LEKMSLRDSKNNLSRYGEIFPISEHVTGVN